MKFSDFVLPIGLGLVFIAVILVPTKSESEMKEACPKLGGVIVKSPGKLVCIEAKVLK